MIDSTRNTLNKSSAIIAFEFGDTAVTAFERNGDAWFVAGEVATALGYAIPRNAIAEHCKAAEICKGPELRRLGIPCSSPRGMSIIPERDLYRLVMRSKLPAAEQFEEKVVAEILPAIRKTGGYTIAGTTLSADTRKVLGGMIKSISRAQIREELAEMESRITNLVATHQAGTAAITDKTAKEWCEEYGLTQKGRNGPRRKIGNALSALAKQQGIICHRCARTGTWLYPAELARPYMDGIGRHIIKLHNSAVLNGQPDLGLGNKRKRA